MNGSGQSLSAQPISFEQEIELPSDTSKRSARKAKLAVRFCPVNLRTPYRFDDRDPRTSICCLCDRN